MRSCPSASWRALEKAPGVCNFRLKNGTPVTWYEGRTGSSSYFLCLSKTACDGVPTLGIFYLAQDDD
jgi:hypothetical protein